MRTFCKVLFSILILLLLFQAPTFAEGANAVTAAAVDQYNQTAAAGLESVLTVNGNVQITSSDFDWQGPAPVTFSAQTANSTTASIVTPGLYFFTVEAHDATGNTYTDTAAVGVWNSDDMDALLRNKWGRLKQTLAAGDLEGAVNMHHQKSREGFRELYTYLGPQLSTIVQEMPQISPVFIRGNFAKYRMYRDEVVNGQTYPIAYYIYFSRDLDGLWSIERY